MAKFAIGIDEITDNGLAVRGVHLSVDGIDEEAVERLARKFVDALGPYNASGSAAEEVNASYCKCEASNGDKRPGTAATYSSRGKRSGNAFAPDVD